MIFRQLFDATSGTYTYLLASRLGGEALIIDPVLEQRRALPAARARARPAAGQGGRHPSSRRSHHRARSVARPYPLHHRDGRAARMPTSSRCGLPKATASTSKACGCDVLYTPGHTDDSYSFLLADRVFTGDTLLIRGTGRTDFQNGDPRAQYDSIFNKLLKLPDETLVYPAHDYKGDTVSTIGEEKFFNPRLKVRSVDEYVELMNNLKLPNPKMMDVAVPANMQVGLRQEDDRAQGLGRVGCRRRSRCRPPRRGARRPAREKRTGKAWHHSRLAARAVSRPRRSISAAGGMLQRIGRRDRQAHRLLLRLRRALGDGGAGGAGRRDQNRLPHRGRHRCLEKGRRTACAVTRSAHSRACGNPGRLASARDSGSALSAFALRASADSKPAVARRASVGGSRGRADFDSIGPEFQRNAAPLQTRGPVSGRESRRNNNSCGFRLGAHRGRLKIQRAPGNCDAIAQSIRAANPIRRRHRRGRRHRPGQNDDAHCGPSRGRRRYVR